MIIIKQIEIIKRWLSKMAFSEEDKTELNGIIKTAIDKITDTFKPSDTKGTEDTTIEIPVPKPPKSNEELIEEKVEEVEKEKEGTSFSKVLKAIWGN